jgi:hypothetical protein
VGEQWKTLVGFRRLACRGRITHVIASGEISGVGLLPVDPITGEFRGKKGNMVSTKVSKAQDGIAQEMSLDRK